MKKVCFMSATLLLPYMAMAQSTFGAISGKVIFNEKGVYGANISLLDESTQTIIKTSSNKSGAYGF